MKNGFGELGGAALARIMVATTLLFASMAIVTPSVEDLVREPFALSNHESSSFFWVHSLPQLLLLGVLAGLLSDRFRRRLPLAFVACVGTGITTMLHPVMPSYGSLLALRLVDGALGIVAIGMLMTRAIDLAVVQRRTQILALYSASIPGGFLLGNLVCALLGEWGPGMVFMSMGAALVLGSLALLVDLRRPENAMRQQPRPAEIFRVVLAARQLRFALFFGFVDKFTIAFLASLLPAALKSLHQMSAMSWGGAALVLFWITYLLGLAPAGLATRRWGPWVTTAIASAVYGLSLVALAATDWSFVFFISIAVAGAGMAMQMLPSFLLVGESSGETGRATAMGAYNLVGSVGIMLGFFVAGFVSQYSYFAAFSVAGAAELIVAIVAASAARTYATASRGVPSDGLPGINAGASECLATSSST